MGNVIRSQKIDLGSIDDANMREQLSRVNAFMEAFNGLVTENFVLQSAGSPKGWQRPHANPGPTYANREEIDDMLKQIPQLEIARGNVPGMSTLAKFGRTDSLAAGDDIWENSSTYLWQSAAQTHTITGGANDDAGGTGALTAELFGLDTNWAPISEVLTMNGVAGVTTTKLFRRTFRLKVLTAGSVGTNDGVIFATSDTDSNTQVYVPAGNGQTLMAIYTVPAGKTLYAFGMYGTILRSVTSVSAELQLVQRPDSDVAASAWQVKHSIGVVSLGNGSYYHPFPTIKTFPAKSDLRVKCSYSSSASAVVNAGFDGILVDD